MPRYETRIDDGSIYVETDGDDLEIGSLEHVYSITEGETYTITYENDYANTVDWLDLDENDELTFDVRDTIASMDYPGAFVRRLSNKSLDADGGEIPERTQFFAESMITVWDKKGNLDDEENPFLSGNESDPLR